MPDFGLNRRRFVQAAGATGLAAALPSTAGATPAQAALADDLDPDGGAQEALVVFDSNDHVAQLENFSLPEGYHRFEVLPIGYTIATGDQLREIAALPSVVHVQPNREAEFHNAEARETTKVTALQSAGFTGENAHVAVIDSGLSNLHPDHRGDVKHNYKYQNPLQRDTTWRDVKPGDTDDNGHGTHVSGTVAGNGTFSETSPVQGQNQKGMAPDATLTVYSTGVTLAVLNFIAAFDHILANHTAETAESDDEVIHLTNNSYGPTSGNGADFNPNAATNVATYECYKAGVLSFFSAGNSGPSTNTYSRYAKAPWVVGVAATNDQKDLAGFSSRGRTTDYDGVTNYDRDLALSNVETLYASQSAEPAASESTGQTFTASGGPVAGAVAAGAVQTAGPFIVDPYSTGTFEIDRYEVRATLTWSPENPEGPEPSDIDFALLDADGNTVAASGSGGTETQGAAEETLTGTVSPDSEYSFEVTGWRGVANWSIEAEVFVVDDGDAPTPSGPYGVYRPDVAATGVSIVSTMSPNDPLQGLDNGSNTSLASPYYAAISGTSMSSPTATGATALVVDAYVDAYDEAPTPEVLFELLEGPGTVFVDDQSDLDHRYGNGFIDVSFAEDIESVTENPNASDGDDSGSGDEEETSDDGDDEESEEGGDGDNDDNGEGEENQDENADEKEDNSDDGGDNGEGDDNGNGGNDDEGGNDATAVSTSYGF